MIGDVESEFKDNPTRLLTAREPVKFSPWGAFSSLLNAEIALELRKSGKGNLRGAKSSPGFSG